MRSKCFVNGAQAHAKKGTSLISVSLIFALLMLGVGGASRAQQSQYEPPPLPVDPTPLIELVTAKERADIDKERANPRKLVEVYLEVANEHVAAALDAIKGDDYKTSERELDIYNKAITEATKTTFSQRDNRRKMAKKIEQKIYKHLKTLEAIERYFPPERVPFAQFALKHARQTRAEALNVTFDAGEILKDPDGKKDGNKGANDGVNENAATMSRRSRQSIGGSGLQALVQVIAYVADRARPLQEVDYLTEEEDDFVRQAQEPDLRAKVFMKIADRRLEAITGKTVDPNDKKAQKKAEEELRLWGALPKLDRAEYLRHYTRAVDEVMIKLEDAFERNPKAKAFEKAMTVLGDATDRHLAILKSLEPQLATEAEKRALRNAIEKAETANQGAKARAKSG